MKDEIVSIIVKVKRDEFVSDAELARLGFCCVEQVLTEEIKSSLPFECKVEVM